MAGAGFGVWTEQRDHSLLGSSVLPVRTKNSSRGHLICDAFGTRGVPKWEETCLGMKVEVPTIRGGPIAKKAENQRAGS